MNFGIKFFVIFMIMIFFASAIPNSFSEQTIPDWVKNNANWWSEGGIDDDAFVSGIQFLIEKKIIEVDTSKAGEKESDGIPDWVKNNAKWWSEGGIDDNTFLNGIAFLVENGIISVEKKDSENGGKDYTVLIYMVGNNLERNFKAKELDLLATRDINEIIAGKPLPSLNIILATGGSEQATPKEDQKRKLDFETIRYSQIINGKEHEIKEIGKVSMGQGSSLSDFIIWGTEKYPAEKVVLILWGHGHATGGYGDDNVHNGDKLSLKELKSSLAKAKESSKVKFELIGFDSCLMATIEVADAISDYGKYMVASEELEVGFGWDYKSIIKSLNKNPKDGAELGKTIVDSFIADVKNLSSNDDSKPHPSLFTTLSVIDLQKIKSLNDSIEKFKDKVLDLDKDKMPELQQALNKAERFGQRGGKDSGQIDIRDFSKIVGNRIPELKDSADSIISNIDSAVIYSQSGESHPNSHGLSVKFQRTENVISTDYDFGPTKGMIELYSNHLKEDKIAPEFSDIKFQNNRITGTYSGNDVYEINFYFTDGIDDEGILEIFSTDEYDADEFSPGKIDFSWDGYEPSLCNSKFCYPINPEWEWGESNDMAYLPVIVYTDLEKSGLRGDLIYDVTNEDKPIFIGFWPVGHDETVFQKNLLPLIDGDYVQIIATLEHWEEEIEYYEPVERLRVDSEFRFSWKVYDWGPLDIWVEICDFSDNCNWTDEPFTINSLDVANVNEKDIIPQDQNDSLNQDYKWGETYELKFYDE